MSADPTPASAADVIAFWREAGPKRWFEKDAKFDDEIRRRFLAPHEAAAAGKLTGWEASAEGALALLILLDQFPRNMFRGQARTFATDPLARAVASRAILNGFDGAFPDLRGFFYLPFEHSEDLADQERGLVALQDGRRCRRTEMGRDCMPISSAVSAGFHIAMPCLAASDAGGIEIPRRRRFCRLKPS